MRVSAGRFFSYAKLQRTHDVEIMPSVVIIVGVELDCDEVPYMAGTVIRFKCVYEVCVCVLVLVGGEVTGRTLRTLGGCRLPTVN